MTNISVQRKTTRFTLIFLFALFLTQTISAFDQSLPDNNTPFFSNNQVVTYHPSLSPEDLERQERNIGEQINKIELRKSNLTLWQRKLSSQLLNLLDLNSTSVMTSEQITQVKSLGIQIIPAEEVSQKLGVSSGSDQILIQVNLVNDVSPESVGRYITKISGFGGNPLYGWVEIRKIETIASLKGVKQISAVSSPINYDNAASPKESKNNKSPNISYNTGETLNLSSENYEDVGSNQSLNFSKSPINFQESLNTTNFSAQSSESGKPAQERTTPRPSPMSIPGIIAACIGSFFVIGMDRRNR